MGAGRLMINNLGPIKYEALGTNLNLIYLPEWLSLVQEWGGKLLLWQVLGPVCVQEGHPAQVGPGCHHTSHCMLHHSLDSVTAWTHHMSHPAHPACHTTHHTTRHTILHWFQHSLQSCIGPTGALGVAQRGLASSPPHQQCPCST